MNHRSPIISLFEEHRPARRGVSSIFLSGVFHTLGAGVLFFGLIHAPRIREPLLIERYSVRHLDLHSSELSSGSPNDRYYPHPGTDRKKDSKDDDQDQPDPILPDDPNALEAKQTLIQPAFHTHASLAEAPVPALVIWTPELAETRQIVAPLPEKPTSVQTKPSLDAPNQELNPAENAITATANNAILPTPPTGSSTPLIANSDSVWRMAPASSSDALPQPTPTALLSISDLRMSEGSVILPPVNQIRAVDNGAFWPGMYSGAQNSDPGWNNPADRSGQPAGSANTGEVRTTQHIEMPRDGQFGVIVVGTSLAEEYPQTVNIWSDRVAYTAYLHVGLAKNWILQYSQLRSADAAGNGSVARLEAPWPYDILRPNLVSSDLNSDALMVHGILNEAGQLESLAVAFPQQFAQASFVLQALEKWQFRPARQQGKPTAVEVLLIIPDELD